MPKGHKFQPKVQVVRQASAWAYDRREMELILLAASHGMWRLHWRQREKVRFTIASMRAALELPPSTPGAQET